MKLASGAFGTLAAAAAIFVLGVFLAQRAPKIEVHTVTQTLSTSSHPSAPTLQQSAPRKATKTTNHTHEPRPSSEPAGMAASQGYVLSAAQTAVSTPAAPPTTSSNSRDTRSSPSAPKLAPSTKSAGSSTTPGSVTITGNGSGGSTGAHSPVTIGENNSVQDSLSFQRKTVARAFAADLASSPSLARSAKMRRTACRSHKRHCSRRPAHRAKHSSSPSGTTVQGNHSGGSSGPQSPVTVGSQDAVQSYNGDPTTTYAGPGSGVTPSDPGAGATNSGPGAGTINTGELTQNNGAGSGSTTTGPGAGATNSGPGAGTVNTGELTQNNGPGSGSTATGPGAGSTNSGPGAGGISTTEGNGSIGSITGSNGASGGTTIVETRITTITTTNNLGVTTSNTQSGEQNTNSSTVTIEVTNDVP
jgi:hypothetical protein